MSKANILFLLGGILAGFSLGLVATKKHVGEEEGLSLYPTKNGNEANPKSARPTLTNKIPSAPRARESGGQDRVLVSKSRLSDLFDNVYTKRPFHLTSYAGSGAESPGWLPTRLKFAAEFLGFSEEETMAVGKLFHEKWERLRDHEVATVGFDVVGPNVLRIDLTRSKEGAHNIIGELPEDISVIVGKERASTFLQLSGVDEAVESGVSGRAVSYFVLTTERGQRYAWVRGERDGAPSSGGSGRGIDSDAWPAGSSPRADLFGDRWSHIFSEAPEFIQPELLPRSP